MRIDILSLFPEMFTGVLQHSMMKIAQEKQAVEISVMNFRDHSSNKHKNVDDYPYGGGAGMVLTAQPIFDAVDVVRGQTKATPRVILMCPQGERFNQKKAEELAQEDHLIFICGHYEGYDERIREHLITDEISIGDYVLTGGELASMVIVDSVVRLLPDVLGNEVSHKKDSFSTGYLEHPQYTRPFEFRGFKVPDVLLSGNHKKIDEWRAKESFRRTFVRRPDLIIEGNLSSEQKKWLLEFQKARD
jgi:tRNA (guanine37-N1)-methyltransferase